MVTLFYISLLLLLSSLKKGLPSLAGILGTFKMFAFVPISYSLAYVIRGDNTYMYTTCNVVGFFILRFWTV